MGSQGCWKDCRKPESKIVILSIILDFKERNLNDQHQDKHKYESCVEIWDIEGGPKSTNQGVSSNNSSQ